MTETRIKCPRVFSSQALQDVYEYHLNHPPIVNNLRSEASSCSGAFWLGFDDIHSPKILPGTYEHAAWKAGRQLALRGFDAPRDFATKERRWA